MARRAGIRRLLSRHLSSADARQEVDDEIETHIAFRVEQLMAEGVPQADARERAERLFAAHRETLVAVYDEAASRNRQFRIVQRIESFAHDIRYAARRLRVEPTVTALIVVMLGLGIGVNVTSLHLLDRLLLRGPDAVTRPDEIVRYYRRVNVEPFGVETGPWLPYSAFESLRASARFVSVVAAYRVDERVVGTGVRARTRAVGRASPELFALLGVSPLRGQFFRPQHSDDRDGSAAVLSAEFWRSEYGSDPQVIGRALSVGGVLTTIVGVAPRGFTGPERQAVAVWTTIGTDGMRSNNWKVIGRLRAGETITTAGAELERLAQPAKATWPAWIRSAHFLAAPLSAADDASPSVESVMVRWLAIIAVIILIITCANVANLMLARLARRQREFAVRIALGSGRHRVIRLVLLEGAMLASVSAVVCLPMIAVGTPMLWRLLLPASAAPSFGVQSGMVLLALGIATLVGVAVSVLPAIQIERDAVPSSLRATRGAGGQRHTRLRDALTVLQSALSVVLLVGAGLFVRSFQRVRTVELGSHPEQVLLVDAQYARLVGTPVEGAQRDRERLGRLKLAVEKVPGASSVSVAIAAPFTGGMVGVPLLVPGIDSIPQLPGGGPYVVAVDKDYFATMGTRIVRGRAFTAADREGSESVTIVGQRMAKMLWPTRDPLGACMHIGTGVVPCARVVGIAEDVHLSALVEEVSMQYYVPLGQERGFSGAALLVRRNGASAILSERIRTAIISADAAVQSVDVNELSDAMAGEVRPLQLGLGLFGTAALLAVIVAGLGLYSLMAYTVAWRTHEIGVRSALGGSSGAIVALVLRGGVVMAAIGIAIGLGVALGARSWLEQHLFRTSGADPLVYGTVGAFLLVVALLAGWVPASRAARISPTEALRAD